VACGDNGVDHPLDSTKIVKGEPVMSSRVLPAVIAVAGGVLLAVALMVPFVMARYRRRGELGWRPTVLALGFLVYAVAIAAYTLLPLPQIDAAWCAAHTALTHPQTNLMQFLADIRTEQTGSGLGSLLRNPAVQQTAFNVILFVPLGAFLRHGFRRGVGSTVVIGFAVSLLVECTQLTGNWFLFPCPYRVFDVDDLATNTIGTALGVVLAPLLAVFEGHGSGLTADTPRPVTTGRRLLGMLLDLVGVTVASAGLAIAFGVVAELLGGSLDGALSAGQDVFWFLPVLVLLVVPVLRGGSTIGQRAVLLRRIRADGRPPTVGQRALALLGGTAGFMVLSQIGATVPLAQSLAGLLVVAAPVVAWRSRGHRGFSGVLSGLEMVDARESAEAPTLPVRLG
jgi:glycopeptide antibiotics resistance protein